jgi:hypothetical protein
VSVESHMILQSSIIGEMMIWSWGGGDCKVFVSLLDRVVVFVFEARFFAGLTEIPGVLCQSCGGLEITYA